MSKMDDIRSQLDKDSTFVPSPACNDVELERITVGEPSKLRTHKVDNNMNLAKIILAKNSSLPPAFKSKFEAMSIDPKFASCIAGVINDALAHGIDIVT